MANQTIKWLSIYLLLPEHGHRFGGSSISALAQQFHSQPRHLIFDLAPQQQVSFEASGKRERKIADEEAALAVVAVVVEVLQQVAHTMSKQIRWAKLRFQQFCVIFSFLSSLPLSDLS